MVVKQKDGPERMRNAAHVKKVIHPIDTSIDTSIDPDSPDPGTSGSPESETSEPQEEASSGRERRVPVYLKDYVM